MLYLPLYQAKMAVIVDDIQLALLVFSPFDHIKINDDFKSQVLVEILPKELLEWKLQMLKSASAYSNSHLLATKAEVLLLCSGRDQLFPSEEEGERLCHALPNCEIRKFDESHHFFFLEGGIDLATIIKGTSFYHLWKIPYCCQITWHLHLLNSRSYMNQIDG
ncbi:hypothetical protein SLE2022_349940 [Rubroshorea leprosula]